jgi:hypothetical protein
MRDELRNSFHGAKGGYWFPPQFKGIFELPIKNPHCAQRQTPNAQRQTVNGERRTANGERRTANGERRTANGERVPSGVQSQEGSGSFARTPFNFVRFRCVGDP